MAEDFETFCDKSRKNLTVAQRDWRKIIQKYDQVFEKSDEIDLNTLTVVKDRGHLNNESFHSKDFGKCSFGKQTLKGQGRGGNGASLFSEPSDTEGSLGVMAEDTAHCIESHAEHDMTVASILTDHRDVSCIPVSPISDAETLSSDDTSSSGSSRLFSDDSSSSLSEDSEEDFNLKKCKMPKMEEVDTSTSESPSEPKEKSIRQWLSRVQDWIPHSPSSGYSSIGTQDLKDDDPELSQAQEEVIDFFLSGEPSGPSQKVAPRSPSPPRTPNHGQVKQMFDKIKQSVSAKKRKSPPRLNPPSSDSDGDSVQRSFDNLWHSQFNSLSIISTVEPPPSISRQTDENPLNLKQRNLFPDRQTKPCSQKSQVNTKTSTARRVQTTCVVSSPKPPPAPASPALPKVLRTVASPDNQYHPVANEDTDGTSSSEEDPTPPPANKSWFRNSWKALHSKMASKPKEYAQLPTKEKQSPRTGKLPDRSLAISQSEESENEQGTLTSDSVCQGPGKCDKTFCFECLSE